MASRRFRAVSRVRGLMTSTSTGDQRYGDLEAGEADALTNGASTTYVPPVRRGLVSS